MSNDPSKDFDIMIVVDYPKKADAKTRLPLQSQSIEVLDYFIEKSNLPKDRIYVTHLVKCPSQYVKPKVSEMKACRTAHLYHELKLIKPEIVILVGNTALRAFNLQGQGSMNLIHGKVFELPFPGDDDGPSYTVVPTFDPYYFIQKENHALKRRVIDDYRTVASLLSKQPLSNKHVPKYHVVDTLKKVKDLCDKLLEQPAFAFDTESCKMPFTEAPVICYSISFGKDDTYIVPIYNHDPNGKPWQLKLAWTKDELGKLYNLLAEPFEDPNIIKIAHNIKYDVNVLRQWGRKSDGSTIRVQGFWADTACYHHLLSEEGPHKLEICVDEELGWGDYSEDVRKIVGQGKELINTYDAIPDEILWPYTACDASGTFLIYEIYKKQLDKKPHLWQLYVEETEPMLKGLANQAEWYGHKQCLKTIDKLLEEYEQSKDKLLSKIKRQTNPDFNPNSTDQVAEALTNLGFGLALIDKKKSSGVSTDKNKLMDLRKDCGLAGDILDFRAMQKIISTYLRNAKNALDSNHRIRHSWYPLAVTGRLTCTFFHQIPKVNEKRAESGLLNLRDMFIAEDGYVLVSGDYSQIELYVISIVANDKVMQEILADPKRDLHAETTFEFLKNFIEGYTIERAKLDKFNRSEVGKRINFGIGYGSQGHALVKTGKWMDNDGIENAFTWPMLNEGLAAWKAKFTGVGDYITNYPDECRINDGVAFSMFMRERRLRGRLNSPDDYVRGESEREAINFRIQSTASSITNRTIGSVYKVIQNLINQGIIEEGDIRLVNTVHDSVIYEVKEHLSEWFVKHILKPIAQRPIKELDNHQFKLDVGVGKTWTQTEEKEAA